MEKEQSAFYKTFIKHPTKKLICWLRGVKAGKNTFISFKAGLKRPENITLGSDVVIENFARIECVNESSFLSIDNGTFIRPYAYLKADNGTVKIGQNCTFNDFCLLNGVGDITIGNDVHIASHTVIVSMNHVYTDPDKCIFDQGSTHKGISIGNNVWIGSSVVILDGVKIGEGSVIGAGSVVTKDIPPFSIAVGVPARAIKSRTPQSI
jgi:acetyltransferase-like isoleucine patch superfamily enzyme